MTAVGTTSAALIAAFAIWAGYFTHVSREMDAAYQKWNEEEWHIDHFARPAPFVRFINAGALGSNGSALLLLLNKTAVSPALRRLITLMKRADEEDVVPKLLCDDGARNDLRERVEEYYADIQSSETLTVVGKLLLYSAAYLSLTNHYGLLKMGMKREVQEEAIKEPVFIVSLPRTGTTILHRTMAHDRQRFRSFDFCDMVCPLPKPIARWDEAGRREKAEEASELLNQLKGIYPGLMECLETMHGFRPGEAEEDLGWYDTGLGHPYMDPLMKLYPQYRSKKDGMGKIESKSVATYRYAWLSMVMKIYQQADTDQWGGKKKENVQSPTADLPWLMKDPNHSAYLFELLREFPNAKLVFTHRDPSDILASMAKLFVMFTSPDFLPGTPGSSSMEWGKESLLRMNHYINGLVNFTKSQQEISPYSYQQASGSNGTSSTSRIDFYFKDIVQDVPGTIATIYKKLYPHQGPPSDQAIALFKAYLAENKREKRGNQRRSLQDFHLTKDDVSFTEYNEMFLSDFDDVSTR